MSKIKAKISKSLLPQQIISILEMLDANNLLTIEASIPLIKIAFEEHVQLLENLKAAKDKEMDAEFEQAIHLMEIAKLESGNSEFLLNYCDLNLTRLKIKAGNHEEASKLLQKCSDYFVKEKHCTKVVQTLILKGHLARHNGDRKKAKAYYRTAHNTSERIDYDLGKAEALNGLGILYRLDSKNIEAISSLVKSLHYYQESGSEYGKAVVLNNLGNIYYNKAEFSKSLDSYLKCLNSMKAVNSKRDIGICLSNIGNAYLSIDNYQLALEYSMDALEVKTKLRDEGTLCYSYATIGKIFEALGKAEEALEYYKKALNIYQATGDDLNAALILSEIGNIHRGQSEIELAIEVHIKCTELLEKIESKLGLSVVYPLLGWDYFANKNFKASYDYFQKALEFAEEIEDKHGIAANKLALGYVYQELGKSDDGISILKEAIDLAHEINSPSDSRDAYKGLAKLYESQQHFKEALESYKLYVSFRDQLLAEKSSTSIVDLEKRFISKIGG